MGGLTVNKEAFDFVSYAMGEKNGGGGASVTVEALSVTENGTVTAPTGKAYSPVTVDVPQRDPYLYENCYALQLSRDPNVWTDDATITIDCKRLTTLAGLCGGTNPGYQKVKLKNVPSTALSLNAIVSGHGSSSNFKFLELDGDLVGAAASQGAFYSCRSLISVTGGSLDLSAATNVTNFAKFAEKLKTISFVGSSIKVSITFDGAKSLTDDSLVSIVNGLNGTVTGQTLTLDSTVKPKLSNIMGTVTDGVFSIDAQGSTTLMDFATVTKG